jgi:hypothetical protein
MFWRKKRGARPAQYDWMTRLAARLARRERLRHLRAPETILEAEERLVRDGMSHLTVAEALFVMRYRDELTRHFDPWVEGRDGVAVRSRDPAQAS